MGYYMQNLDGKFLMKAENKAGALEAMKAMMEPKTLEANGRGGSFGPNGKTETWYSWVTTKEVLAAKTVEEAIEQWGWETVTDEESGDITEMYFPENKIGQEELMFQAIAPFVEKGSFFHMLGEDGSQWRWYFNGESLEDQYPKKVEWE
jgi:hypothetical protein